MIEADLLRYFGVDLLDLGADRLSWRRLRNLISRMPRESQTAREVHGPSADWGAGEHLLALIADLLQVANWQRTDTSKNPPPTPIERPTAKKPERLDPDKLARMLLEQRRRLGG